MILAVAQERFPQDALARGTQLPERRVTAAVGKRRTRLERCVPSVSNANSMVSRAPSPKTPVPQNSEATTKPHSAVPKSGSSDRTWNRPIAVSDPRDTIAKQTYWPAARCRCVQAVNFSKPSTVVGGGEMKRVTSSVVSATNSDRASPARSSRSVTSEPVSVGRPLRQPFFAHGAVSASGPVEITASTSACSRYGIFSIRRAFPSAPRCPRRCCRRQTCPTRCSTPPRARSSPRRCSCSRRCCSRRGGFLPAGSLSR